MPLDVAAQPGFLTALFGDVVLFSIRYEPMGAGMVGVVIGGLLVLTARVKLLQYLAAGLSAVSAFCVILRAFLVTVAVLHGPLL
jgi:hypothetical protein